MKLFFPIQEEWWRSLLFLLWIIALTSLLLNQSYTIFLRPEFGILIGLGVLALSGFLISGCYIPKQRPLALSEIIRGCILILPLAYMLNSGEQGLDASAFQNRSLGLPSVAACTPAAVSPGSAEASVSAQPAPPASVADTENNDETRLSPQAMEEVSILNIYMAPDKYKKRMISVIGMLTRDEEVQQEFGDKATILFRFAINCCAADAVPLALVILNSDPSTLPDNTWVKVRGVFELEEKKQDPIPLLKQATMEATKAPKIPYLF